MVIIGVLFTLIAVALVIGGSYMNDKDGPLNTYGSPKWYKSPDWLLKLHSFRFPILGVGLILTVISSFFFYSRPGHQYYVLDPFGNKTAVFTQGYKFKVPFSRVNEWEKYIDVNVVFDGEPEDGISGVIYGGIPIRFIDQVTANVDVSVRLQMPQDPESFIKLVEEFRHPLNLTNNTLIPTVREQVINTGYMFTASDYISGAASDFRVTLDDQLKNGGLSTFRETFQDTVYSPIQVEGQRVIKDIRTTYKITRRRNSDGSLVRIPHDITKNNITVTQAIVDQLDLDPEFKNRLNEQKKISAQKRIELEKIETAKAQQQRIVAEGEAKKAAERVAQETEQVKRLIAIETALKQEETNKKLAAIKYETEKLQAQALRVKKDAEAYANKKLVLAGLTPQEEAKIWKDTQIGVAKALAGPDGLTLPSTYLSGGSDGKSGNNQQDVMNLLLLQILQQNEVGKINK